jgi:hypothetical protein
MGVDFQGGQTAAKYSHALQRQLSAPPREHQRRTTAPGTGWRSLNDAQPRHYHAARASPPNHRGGEKGRDAAKSSPAGTCTAATVACTPKGLQKAALAKTKNGDSSAEESR